MGHPHGHCDGNSCDECSKFDSQDIAMAHEDEKTAATFAALVEVARLSDEIRSCPRSAAILERYVPGLWKRFDRAVSNVRALNPKLLEKEN